MTSYRKECNSLKPFIPLYVKGALPDAQMQEIENAVTECPELKEEVRKWKEINNAYQAIESTLPEPSGFLFSRITGKLSEAKKPGLLSWLFGSPTVSFVLVAAQFLLILSLGFYIIQEKHEYKTMSAPSIKTEDYIMINVIFKEQATESEIRDLLLKINGRIVDGPTRSGLYIVGIKSREEADSGLDMLQKSAMVKMAEKAY